MLFKLVVLKNPKYRQDEEYIPMADPVWMKLL